MKPGDVLVGYYVREGKVRGEGRYLGYWACHGPDWRDRKSEAFIFSEGLYGRLEWSIRYGGRVVRLIRRARRAEEG